MTENDIKRAREKLELGEKYIAQIKTLEDRIKILNAEMDYLPGDTELMVRQKPYAILPLEVFPYKPTDNEIIELGSCIQGLYAKKIEDLKAQLANL